MRTHKIALCPTVRQEKYFVKAAGCARFAYNWALSEWELQYHFHKLFPHLINAPSYYSLHKYFSSIKKKQYPFVLEVTKCAVQCAMENLERAFKNFFAGRGKYPCFKKKGVHDSFKITVGNFKVRERAGSNKQEILIPRLGWVKMSHHLRFTGKLVSATISRVADRWFAAIVVDTVEPEKFPVTSSVCGVDVGVRDYVTSEGDRYALPRSYRQVERRLRRLQQGLSRKKKGGKNRKKQQLKIARLHARTTNIRKDFLHKLTHKLVSENQVTCIEDLNVKGMVRNRRLAKSISDAAFYEFRRQLEYKTVMYGRELIVVDRWYPSSKTCSTCGNKYENINGKMPLSIRIWACKKCGTRHDRDVNAAKNLKQFAVSSTVTVPGELLTADIGK